MKGFIEVTEQFSDKKNGMNILTIVFFRDGFIVQDYNGTLSHNEVKESYEQIKKLIKQAQ